MPTEKDQLTEVNWSLFVNVLNQSPSPPQQYAYSKDQDAAEDREEPCARAAGVMPHLSFSSASADLCLQGL